MPGLPDVNQVRGGLSSAPGARDPGGLEGGSLARRGADLARRGADLARRGADLAWRGVDLA